MKVKDILNYSHNTDMRIIWNNDIGNFSDNVDIWNNWEHAEPCPDYILDKAVTYLHAEKDETLTIAIAI